ncbi:protein of unknown function (plasmid) [Cardinium endosymbiont cEper1 of Encarsia pergandiella]|nr:protein of unknown function [Cardinium endosymbiont cEper1 of Encarsia pergandiella]
MGSTWIWGIIVRRTFVLNKTILLKSWNKVALYLVLDTALNV